MADTIDYSIHSIFFEVKHEADGKKYSNYIKESYRLNAKGILEYDAYFGGMPISMNHNDGIDWDSGKMGRKVFTTVLSLLKKPFNTTGLKIDSDTTERSDNERIYFLSIAKNGNDVRYFVDDPMTEAFKEIDLVLRELINAFEKATGRPLKIGDLPQRKR